LHLPPVARPARRICGLHATLAVQEADSKGWFDDEHEAPKVSEASWESPKFDHQLMHKFLSDTSTADVLIEQSDGHAAVQHLFHVQHTHANQSACRSSCGSDGQVVATLLTG